MLQIFKYDHEMTKSISGMLSEPDLAFRLRYDSYDCFEGEKAQSGTLCHSFFEALDSAFLLRDESEKHYTQAMGVRC